jgi:hypothetical protein
MITKSKLARGVMPTKYQSRRHRAYGHALLSEATACSPPEGETPEVKRRAPRTIQAYLFVLLWVILLLSVVDGLAAVAFHVG